ncbi:armadillo-type protein [Blastocladiella britannica]|nr:armadillo-type protein [Blastocladiella britannica]
MTDPPGLVALLDEHDESLKNYALENLNVLVDQFWPEIADSIPVIEVLYEDPKFKHRHTAALVAAKVYYHLGDFDESLTFALGAGQLFDLTDKSQFVETIIAKCIDKYIALRTQQFESSEPVMIDAALEDVVERMFKRCFSDHEFKQAIGIALESRRLDVIQDAVKLGDAASLLQYVLECSLNVVQHRGFRNQILRLLVQLYSELSEPDYLSMGQCLVTLDDANGCAELLNKLTTGSSKHKLLGLQLAFDLEDTATQKFLRRVDEALTPATTPVDAASAAPTTADHVRRILTGTATIQMHLEFLHRNNKSDLLILKQSKNQLDARSSLYHSAVSFSNAIMNAGTTCDQFLRDNLEWLSRANNWSKFSATASLGVIHKGNLEHSMALLKPYLPQEGVSGSAYSEGGALFALGLMNANHAQPLEYLRAALKDAGDETRQHGACLGLGVSGMSTGHREIYEELKTTLFTDSAVAGEAAGLAMGLVMAGTGDKVAIEEMLQYAHETQHEKIIRGTSLGMALIVYGQEEEADATIDRLLADKDALVRYGGIYAVALAYAGTGNNKALRRLLHVAVSDVNDDVRRAAVTSIGFVLSNVPAHVPRVVELLSESFNPNVRYGACMALGVSCASTNDPEALALLEPLLKDSVDFVRQGAVIANAMIVMQHTGASVTKFREHLAKVISDRHETPLAKFGAVLAQGILDAAGRNAHISLRTRSGTNPMLAVIGMVVFLQYWSWYPLTLFLSLTLAPTALIGVDAELRVPKFEFTSNARPSAFAYPPPTVVEKTEKIEKVQMALSTTAKAKARARKREEAASGMDVDGGSASVAPSAPASALASPTTEHPPASASAAKSAAAALAAGAGDGTSGTKPKSAPGAGKRAKEPTFEKKENLSRVVPQQEQHLSFDGAKYVPVKRTRVSGILLLERTTPVATSAPDAMDVDETAATAVDEFIELSASKPKAPAAAAAAAGTDGAAEAEGPEPAPPAPFEFPFDD